MNLVTRYALACGNHGITKPEIPLHYYPLNVGEYITIHAGTGASAKVYDYWQDVINFINPILARNNITIIQIGEGGVYPKDHPQEGQTKEYALRDVHSLLERTNLRQSSFLIRNALMHISSDTWSAHVAGILGVPNVTLYSTNYKENVYPYWGQKEKMVLLEPNDDLLPSFSMEENPKRVNEIKVEEIIAGIQDIFTNVLKRDIILPKIESLFRGDTYNKVLAEVIPNNKPVGFSKDNLLNVRMDYEHNEMGLARLLMEGRRISLIADKPININLLEKFKHQIITLVYICTGTEDESEFLNEAQFIVKLHLTTRAKETEHLKFLYMDIGLIHEMPYIENKFPQENVAFRTNKFLIDGNEIYMTKNDWINKRPIRQLFEPVPDNIEEELNFGYVFRFLN